MSGLVGNSRRHVLSCRGSYINDSALQDLICLDVNFTHDNKKNIMFEL